MTAVIIYSLAHRNYRSVYNFVYYALYEYNYSN